MVMEARQKKISLVFIPVSSLLLLLAVAKIVVLGALAIATTGHRHEQDNHGSYDDDAYPYDSIPRMCVATGDGTSSTSCDKVADPDGDLIETKLKSKLDSPKWKNLRVDLVHLDHHPASPLHKPLDTFIEKMKPAVKRSKKRASAVTRTVASASGSGGKKRLETDLNSLDRTFSSRSQDSFESPVHASPGSYVMTISLGTPPQTKTAIADTGSDLVWLQCGTCISCYEQDDPVFNPSRSSTFRNMPCTNPFCDELPYHACNQKICRYGYAYGDQSTTQGDFATDTISLTTMDGKRELVNNFAFGCGHKNKGTFSGTDGLVGLGQGSISFTSQLGKSFGNKFSYCLVSVTDAATSTSPLIFGDAAVSPPEAMKYTPLVRNNLNPTFYYVLLSGISVGGQLVNIPARAFDINSSGGGGVILDSGTTITMLIQKAYAPFLAKIKSQVEYTAIDSSRIGLDLCYDLSQIENPSFPTVTLHMANVDLELPTENVFLTVDDQSTTCLAFAGTPDFSIIGNIQQQNYHILYDLQKQRVGFAPAQCDAIGSEGDAQAA